MARAQADVNSPFTFVKGLITEASRISEPDNSASDMDNIEVSIDGAAKRRLGLILEEGGSLVNIGNEDYSEKAIHNIEWKNVNGNASLNFEVIQIGLDLHFFSWATPVLSSEYLGSISFSTAAISSDLASISTIDATPSSIGLICTNQYTEPFVLIYNTKVDPAQFILKKLTLRIRDFNGIPDGLRIDENPITLSELHFYNLMNQGWVEPGDSGLGDNSGTGAQGGPTNTPSSPRPSIDSNVDYLTP